MITSYAQNFEDVILWRALGHVTEGLYVDVGAQHPVIDSVSKAFYEHGWRGFHVEPAAEYASLLRQDRPDETVLQVALAANPGTLKFYEFPDTGLSTGDADVAERHRNPGFAVREVIVACITLADVFAQIGDREIHWLKIDVEGLEKMVLSGWAKSIARPWVVVVESTQPLTQVESHQPWEPLLLKRGYSRVYFDGLNRFYVSQHHPELLPSFGAGPNVFDGFSLSGTASAPFCTLVNTRLAELEVKRHLETARLIQVDAERQAQADLAAQRTTQQLQASESEFQRVSRVLAEETQHRAERESELLQRHAKLEEALAQQLHAGHEEIWRLEKQRSERELALVQKGAIESTEFRREIEASLRSLLEREGEFAQQLLLVRQDADLEKTALLRTITEREHEFAREHAERERGLLQQLQASQADLQGLRQEVAAREKEHAEAVHASNGAHAERERALLQQLQASQADLQGLIQEVAAREKAIVERDEELAQQLLQVRREAEQQREALAQGHAEALHASNGAHAEREQGLLQQLDAGQADLRALRQDMTAREKVLVDQAIEARREIDAMLRTLAQRDQEFARQLIQVQGEAEQEREALLQQLEASQDEQRKLGQEATVRDRHQAQQAFQSRENLESSLRELACREAEFSDQLFLTRQASSEREQALAAQQAALESQIASFEGAIQAHMQAQELQRTEHSVELGAKQNELRLLAQVKDDLEANLHAMIRVGQQTILGLHGELGALQREVETIRVTLFRRSTAPLRSLAVVFGRQPFRTLAPASTVQEANETPDGPLSINGYSHSNPGACDMFSITSSSDTDGITPAESLDELLSYHGIAFLRCTYLTLLGRKIDSEGARYYSNRLRSGISKIQILAEIALSKEGRMHATLIPGLNEAIRPFRWRKVPLFGFLLRLVTGPGDNSPLRMQLRVIENQILELCEETQRCFNPIEQTLINLSEEAQVRSNQIDENLNQMRRGFDARPAHPSHDGIETRVPIAANRTVAEAAPMPTDGFREPEALHDLTSSARDIYFQLTSAAAIHRGKVA